MASGSAIRTYHSTLVALAADTVTLAANYRTVIVVNRGTGDIFATCNSVAGPAPVAGANETWVIPANTTVIVTNYAQMPIAGSAPLVQTVVQLVSTGTPAYSVEGN